LCFVFCFISGRDILPPVNGWSYTCKEHASAENRPFPNETKKLAAQLLLNSRGAAQILRA